MAESEILVRVPWDTAAFGVDVWEIRPDARGLAYALGRARAPGIYTVRIDPLTSKEPLHRFGFYYCDSQILSDCSAGQLRYQPHASVGLQRAPDLEPLLDFCREAFSHSHFHRDFRLDRAGADRRFENWLREMHRHGGVYQATWEGSVAGCFAHSGGGRLALYATAPEHRGLGRSRHLFAAGCVAVLASGEARIVSSVSVSNLPIHNIVAGLGFRIFEAVDIYHRVIP